MQSIKEIFWNGLLREKLWKENKYIVSYNRAQKKTIDFVKTLKKKEPRLWGTNYPESYNLFKVAQSCKKTKGMYAEVGVYSGETAKIIWHAKGERRFAIFDTFEGIPEVEDIDKKEFEKGGWYASLENVKDFLKDCDEIEIVRGIFPESGKDYVGERFAFVHLDVDTYKSTKGCLEFFYPRMNKGGVIVSHDYQLVEGVTKAFDEFFIDKPEVVLEISSTQCAVVKL